MCNFKVWWALCLSLILIGVIALVPADFWGKPHMSEYSCGRCHLADPTVNPGQAGKLLVSQEVMCGSCHEKALQMSHPSGFLPKRSLPAEYPADWKGDLTCSSCHNVHGSTPGLLRGNKHGQEMCLSCHNRHFFQKMKDRGTSLQQTGHLSLGISLGNQLEIDAQSLQCISCHENSSSLTGVRIGANGILHHNNGQANHPIGQRYPEFSRNADLHPRSALPEVILLPDGKISCVSCHQVYKQEHGKLVMSNKGSALCLQCHNL